VKHALHPIVEPLYRSFLIPLALMYLFGQACVGWGWQVTSPLWLGGFAVLTLIFGVGGGARLAVLVCGLFLAFSVANVVFQRVLDPRLPPEHLRHLALPRQVIVEGWLFREPEQFTHRARLSLEALQVWEEGTPRLATGKIQLTVRFLSRSWRYGDVLRLPLRLRTPRNFYTPGSFDYESYLARQGIYLSAFLWDDKNIEHLGNREHLLRGRIEQARRTIRAFFNDHLDDRTAAILRALIIGDTGGLGNNLRETFSRAGVAHVLAISGLHIGLVAVAAYGAWWWLLSRSRYLLLACSVPKLAALLTIPPVLLYAGLAGGSVATWRAVVMVLVYLLAILLDRQDEVYRSLALAALLISLCWPGAVLDISFQLSFLAMLAILLGMERFSTWWAQLREHRLRMLYPRYERVLLWGATYIMVSTCALLGTAPITAAHFNQVALAGLLANLVVVPLLGSAAVILGLIAAGLIFLHTGLAAIVLFCAGVVIHIGAWVVSWIAAWPYAAVAVVTPTFLELSLLYGILAGLFLPLSRFRTSMLRHLPLLCLTLLLIDSAVWIWHRHFHRDLRVWFLDVGQGDAAVVEFPGSHVMVIDGGGFASESFDAGEAILAPFLWSRKISRVDTLVMSHPQLDHYGGLIFLAERFSVREFWWNGERGPGERFARLEAALGKQGVTKRVLCREIPATTIAGIQVHILHPPCQSSGLNPNDASLVLRLSHGTIDLVFTGDIEAQGERSILTSQRTLASEIVKVPHHGSRTSSTLAFVEAVSPQLAVMSLGSYNRYRFPAPEVLQRYADQGSLTLRTDLLGTVLVKSDGHSYQVRTTLPLPQ
jgi:competence protein ComEC